MNRRAAPHRGIDAHYGDGDDQRPSKTQLKQASHALQKLGLELAELSDEALQRVPMGDGLREAIDTYRRTRSHEGRRRQLQYVGKLMRGEDEAALREALAQEQVGSARATLLLHEVERWRDRLVDDDEALTAWTREYPDSDLQQLRSLVRAARRDQRAVEERQPKSARELFQFIKPFVMRRETDKVDGDE